MTTKKPRRRALILSPKQRAQFVEEYGKSTTWGGKKAVCEKYEISEGQATHLIEEFTLGAKKRAWASYTPTQQHDIMQEYVNAPEGKKRDIAFSYGLMTRSISAAIGRAKEKNEAPEPEYQALHPVANAPRAIDYDRARRGITNSFAQGDPEIRVRRSTKAPTMEPATFKQTPPQPQADARDELWELYKRGQISQEAFNTLLEKFKG